MRRTLGKGFHYPRRFRRRSFQFIRKPGQQFATEMKSTKTSDYGPRGSHMDRSCYLRVEICRLPRAVQAQIGPVPDTEAAKVTLEEGCRRSVRGREDKILKGDDRRGASEIP